MKEQLLQYNIAYDRTERDVTFIAKQLETHLRERFNVLVSTVEYGIIDGHLVRQGTKEPFIDSIKRGRDVIQRLSPNPVDLDRENAEVIGYEKIDTFLSDPTTPLNSKMLSISPKGEDGSKYQHNFYDIFTLKARDGKKYVELSRYSSGLTLGDYAKRFGLDLDDPPKAKYYLANPIKGGVVVTPEQIHEALHIDHAYMTAQDFDEIWTSYLVQAFVRRYELKRDARSFNAVLNAADEVWENKNKREKGEVYRDYSTEHTPSYIEIRGLEEKEVRQVTGGCPGKSGADTDSPFSVSDFASLGKDRGYDFDTVGTCVVCNSGPKPLGPCAICEKCTVKIEKEEARI